MSTTNATQPCQCLRTKNPYGSSPHDAESWLPASAPPELLVHAHHGAGGAGRPFRPSLPLRAGPRLLRRTRRVGLAERCCSERLAPTLVVPCPPALLVLKHGLILRRERGDAASARHSLRHGWRAGQFPRLGRAQLGEVGAGAWHRSRAGDPHRPWAPRH